MFEKFRSRSPFRGLLVAISLTGASALLAEPAMAGRARDAAPPPQMAMGAAALPPVGFLDFCRRTPQDCAEPSGDRSDTEALRTEATRRFWQTAFARSAVVSTHTAPASLGASPATRPDQTTRYDWSEVFAVRRAALSAPTLADATATASIDAASSIATISSDLSFTLVTALSADLLGSAVVVVDAPAVELDALKTDSVAALRATDPLIIPPTPLTLDPSSPSAATTEGVALAGAGLVGTVATPHPFSLDRAGWRLVNGVNRRVNRQIRRAADTQTYGEEDYWSVPQGNAARGDCEDFVLAKRRALIEAGVPEAALSIAIVQTPWRESHAVLLIAAEQGEYVLDSLTPWITRWDRVNYEWRERQRLGHPFDWVQAAI